MQFVKMQKYNTINDDTRVSIDVNNEYYKRHWNNFCDICNNIGFGLFCILLAILALFAIYALFILIGILLVLFNTIFENTIVYLFGRNIYNKNFPVCTSTSYSGNDCYTTTSTYCN